MVISSEWLKADPQRTAIGLDFDKDALQWGMKNNFDDATPESCTRMCFLEGNVLNDISQAKNCWDYEKYKASGAASEDSDLVHIHCLLNFMSN